MKEYGPTLEVSKKTHADKYRGEGESFKEGVTRFCQAVADDDDHFKALREICLDMRFLAAGRVQASMGAPRETTPYNCFVSRTIPDSLSGIMSALTEAAQTMKLGGGIGYDFSTLRPSGDRITTLDSSSSGPLSFMDVFDAMCKTILSAGHRRGAQMGVLRVDHPDIEAFIRAKQNDTRMCNFNISVAVTDEFMQAVKADTDFDLCFDGRVYKTVRAVALWDEILRSTWDWAEPGILFIDTIAYKNNLYYCESIAATNPCGEQPLPPYGACLLGSLNLTKYLEKSAYQFTDFSDYSFNFEQMAEDIPHIIRGMDNIVDRAVYPLMQQEGEARSKRRMGIGLTGVANTIEAMGHPYGTPSFLLVLESILIALRDSCYHASIDLAIEKGPFPLFERDNYLDGGFVGTLPLSIQARIFEHGIRNSHLLSIAPTGTISLCADNVSSGIEPVFALSTSRRIITEDGPKDYSIPDYGYAQLGVAGKTADQVPVADHVAVLNLSSKYVDSACSKTCNVGSDVSWDDFKDVYMSAWEGGSSGCTTFRAAGKRFGILNSEDTVIEEKVDGSACYIDLETGQKECS